ncbi:MAG: sigma-54-dependent Fis family transcriptional regulator [Phycisphaeraceae bacterium]|nr:sigma-54-dependent Fis family transcriptional regulator [Phycisphaerales bacterium]MCB9861045.1 sigma-54-dependent Fis family transcriptional regulator [Phycisphaeraceae bacterium]
MSGVGESSKPSRAIVAQILLVEDDADHAEVMADALHKPGHICTIVSDVAGAMDELRGGTFDVVVTDLRMPNSGGVSGLDGQVVASDGGNAGLIVLQAARALQSQAETIMVTAHGDVPTARSAFKEGAFDFIEKPLDLEVFRSVVNRAAETVLLRHEGDSIGEGLSELVQHDGFEGIIAASEPMRRIFTTIKTVAPSKLPVLVTGESGTGKELIAQAVHTNSDRSGKRFATFNAAGQAESLLEDQLFGHVKGAFTGADKERAGVFEYANGGTLFLDEIGDMPLNMQAKLLRVLESGEVIRLGSNDPRHVDVRFVSATNRDLEQMVRDGTFRQDLFFRIKGAHVHLPPLRDRRDDIPRIVRHALAKFADQLRPGAPAPDITDAALLRLTAFDWPGNVRELLNVVQGAVVQAIGSGDANMKVDVQHLPENVRPPDDPVEAGEAGHPVGSLAGTSLEAIEKRAIRETLKLTGGNREQAATLLGIGERTLYRKLKEYGLR